MHRVSRRGVIAAIATALAGCSTGDGDDAATSEPDGNPALAPADGADGLALRSPAFDDGGSIPRQYGRNGADVNPPLEVTGVPDDAAALAVVVDDPDAVEAAGEVFVHWLVWNVPLTTVPENWSPETAVEGTNDFGEVGYGGPAPPDGPHTYRFKCFALDGTLELEAGATVEKFGPALEGRVLARAQLEGTYAP